MIARHWKGIAKKDRADEYIDHLKNETFKGLDKTNGFLNSSILTRNVEAGTEFLVITEWKDVNSIKSFAGEDYGTAVVPQVVKDIMVSYDQLASHYEIAYTNRQ
jgi:heme-degrading monooxygenase HmoA